MKIRIGCVKYNYWWMQTLCGRGVRYLFNGTYDDFLKIRLLDHRPPLPPLPQNHHHSNCVKNTLVPPFCEKIPGVLFEISENTRPPLNMMVRLVLHGSDHGSAWSRLQVNFPKHGCPGKALSYNPRTHVGNWDHQQLYNIKIISPRGLKEK